MFAGCIHPVFASARRTPAAVTEKEGQSAACRKKADMRRPRSTWVREWLSEDRRQQLGHYSTFLTRELRSEDVNAFQNHLRMPPELFDEILERVTSCSRRERRHEVPLCPTIWTEAVSDSETHGHWRHYYSSLSYAFQCSKAAICHIVPELCRAIVEACKDEVFAVPVKYGIFFILFLNVF